MKNKTKDQLIAFERRVADEFAAGNLPFLVHISGGNEDQLIEIFRGVQPGDWVLSTHRNHYHYLLAGGSEEKLMSEIKAGRSMFIYDRRLNFLTSSVLGGLCAVAAGLAFEMACQKIPIDSGDKTGWIERQRDGSWSKAMKLPRHVWCFLGDGAEDNGHLYEAALFVQAHNLPCTFVIEDNGYSVDSSLSHRSGCFRPNWGAAGLTCIERYSYCRTFPHAGPGLKTMIQFKPEIVQAHIAGHA